MPYPQPLVQRGLIMTTFGHSLTGVAIATLAIPAGTSWKRRLILIICFIALASLPDWPLPGWGHHRLAFSHSLWVNLVLCTTVALGLRKGISHRRIETALLWSGAAAWLSHFLLDMLYADLPGVAIFWPLSDGLASLPIPWLRTLPHMPPPFDPEIVRILFFEAITFTPLILLAYGWRKWLRKGGR